MAHQHQQKLSLINGATDFSLTLESKMTEKVDQEHMPNNTPILRWDGAAGSSRVWDSLQGVGTYTKPI